MQAALQKRTIAIFSRQMSDGSQATLEHIRHKRFRWQRRVTSGKVSQADDLDSVLYSFFDKGFGLARIVIAAQNQFCSANERAFLQRRTKKVFVLCAGRKRRAVRRGVGRGCVGETVVHSTPYADKFIVDVNLAAICDSPHNSLCAGIARQIELQVGSLSVRQRASFAMHGYCRFVRIEQPLADQFAKMSKESHTAGSVVLQDLQELVFFESGDAHG